MQYFRQECSVANQYLKRLFLKFKEHLIDSIGFLKSQNENNKNRLKFFF